MYKSGRKNRRESFAWMVQNWAIQRMKNEPIKVDGPKEQTRVREKVCMGY